MFRPYPGRRSLRAVRNEPDPLLNVVDNMAVAFEVPGCLTEDMLAEKVVAAMQKGLCEPDEITIER